VILLEAEQGTQEWLDARLGIPTASNFSRVCTPKTMKRSSSQDGYLDELLAEWMIGASLDSDITDLMLRGTELEGDARRLYQFQRDVDVQQVGLCLTDDRRVGASPDALVGEDGGLELKSPTAKVQAHYLRTGTVADTYKCQVQGCLWVCEREWWDVLAFHPEMPHSLIRVERDDEFIAVLSEYVMEFCDKLEAAKLAVRVA